MQNNLKKILYRQRVNIAAAASFMLPLVIYILTLERKVIGGDTTWYALKLPEMQVMVPTGYPAFSIIGKVFSMLPFADLAYRLNLISAIFGALTILFLFLAMVKLSNNVPASLASSLIFAFIFTYWSVASRLEFDTINSFFLALIFYSAFLYAKNPQRKYLYFFAAAAGLGLTNHPILLFVLPAIIIYVIIANPRTLKSIKAILFSILFFILPLSLYMWLPIRSLQGYGPVTTFKSLVYYVTGRGIEGGIHGGSFGDKSMGVILNTGAEFFTIIFKSTGIMLIALAAAGLVYLFVKNYRFAICSILMIIFNVIIVSLYLDYVPDNYTLNVIMIITIYAAWGFLLLYDLIKMLSSRLGKDSLRKVFNYTTATILSVAIFSLPALLAVQNYSYADNSEPKGIYLFWNEAIDNMEEGSIIYIFTPSANVGMYVNNYEKSYKNITFIRNNDPLYNIDLMKENVLYGARNVYFAGTDPDVEFNFETQRVGGFFYWDWHDETIYLRRLVYPSLMLELSYMPPEENIYSGRPFFIEYTIKNLLDRETKITSMELEIPEEVEFLGSGRQSFTDQLPGKARGMYMWVSDDYYVRANGELKMIVELRPQEPGEFWVKFRITASNLYIDAGEFKFEALR